MRKHPLPCLSGPFLLLCLAGPVGAQTTAFTYQGRLTEGGAPANGRYDLIFQAFDASAAGSSIGGAVGTNGVPVTNGLFTVRLDFGATPFTGLRRWLQIQVSTNGAGSYTTLAPRQELTPAPLAIYANTAGTVTNGGIGSAQLAASSVATASLQNNSVTAGKIASGQVVKSLNGLTDAVSLTQGANVTINTVGNSLQISAPAGGLTLPYTGSGSSASQLFSLTNTGSGSAIYGKSTTTGNEGKLVTSLEGVYGASAATYGSGVGGYYYGANGVGVHGEHVQSGNYGELGYPVRGVFGRAAGATSVGVDGTHAPSGNYGYLGMADRGVYGKHDESGNYGELGTANVGAYAWNDAGRNAGSLGTTTYGVLGQCFESTQNNAAVQGDNFVTSVHGSLARYVRNPKPYGPTEPTPEFTGVAVYGRDDATHIYNYAGIFDGRVLIQKTGPGAPLIVRRSDGTDGRLVEFPVGDDFSGGISYGGSFVTYFAFTGSHLAWTDEPLQLGELVRMTGTNRWAKADQTGEIIYGVTRSTTANDRGCLGSYLARDNPSKTGARTNQHLIMAVGNGTMWVTDRGTGDLHPGNFLISSDVPGCAMKDDPERFAIGYICARASESVAWRDVPPDAQGIRRKKIAVLYEAFERHSSAAALAATIKAQQQELDSLKAEVKSLRSVQDRLAKLEALWELNRSVETTQAVAKKSGAE